MNAFTVNKVVGSFLFAVLVALMFGHFSTVLVNPHVLTKPVYLPSGEAAAPSGAAAAAGPAAPPIAPLLAAASADAGKTVFRQCSGCHDPNKGGKNETGPALWDVVGRHKAGIQGFNYSPAMHAAADKPGDEATWTYEDLNQFIASPKGFIPGTRMGFPGLRKAEDRANVIAYLRSLSDSPKPLP